MIQTMTGSATLKRSGAAALIVKSSDAHVLIVKSSGAATPLTIRFFKMNTHRKENTTKIPQIPKLLQLNLQLNRCLIAIRTVTASQRHIQFACYLCLAHHKPALSGVASSIPPTPSLSFLRALTNSLPAFRRHSDLARLVSQTCVAPNLLK